MKIHALDVGQTQYGDCLAITNSGRTILVDGAHSDDSELITEQLAAVVGAPAPFVIDLLVITHCHSDHIGCLPALVNDNVLAVRAALVADEKLGFGIESDQWAQMQNEFSSQLLCLYCALQEEDYSDLSDETLVRQLHNSRSLYDSYVAMLDRIISFGGTVVRYRPPDSDELVRLLEADFADFGLRVLGPTENQLNVCFEAIVEGNQRILRILQESMPRRHLGPTELAAQYRAFSATKVPRTLHRYRTSVGAAKNNQSIVLRVGNDRHAALLPGDMQCADPQVSDLDDLMFQLRRHIADSSPFDIVKLPHHTSDNGFDESLYAEWQNPKILFHSGGSEDAKHPHPDVLDILSDLAGLTFARTDRNGMMSVVCDGAQSQVSISKGQLNDFSANARRKLMRNLTVGSHRSEYDFTVAFSAPRNARRVSLKLDADLSD